MCCLLSRLKHSYRLPARPPARPAARPSVRPPVRPSVRPSVRLGQRRPSRPAPVNTGQYVWPAVGLERSALADLSNLCAPSECLRRPLGGAAGLITTHTAPPSHIRIHGETYRLSRTSPHSPGTLLSRIAISTHTISLEFFTQCPLFVRRRLNGCIFLVDGDEPESV